MTREPYAENHLLFYPGSSLSAEERRRMETYEITIDELTVDHLVYSMSRQIENNFQSLYTVAQELAGEEKALSIARALSECRVSKPYYSGLTDALLPAQRLLHVPRIP